MYSSSCERRSGSARKDAWEDTREARVGNVSEVSNLSGGGDYRMNRRKRAGQETRQKRVNGGKMGAKDNKSKLCSRPKRAKQTPPAHGPPPREHSTTPLSHAPSPSFLHPPAHTSRAPSSQISRVHFLPHTSRTKREELPHSEQEDAVRGTMCIT